MHKNLSFTWHSLYEIMFNLPVTRDHLSLETTNFIPVSLYINLGNYIQ